LRRQPRRRARNGANAAFSPRSQERQDDFHPHDNQCNRRDN
jgi:hypothetical protein